MFTAIIAQKEYIEKANEYKLFLKPFLSSKEIGFCQWNTSGKTFTEMLPDLPDVVGRRREWRAIIICDEEGLTKENPFDLVKYEADPPPEISHGITEEETAAYKEYFASEHEKKLLAYEKAAEKPLTRLATFFCQGPTVTNPLNEKSSDLRKDDEYMLYVSQARKKEDLRAAIKGDEILVTVSPCEVICIAKRTCVSENDFATAWDVHLENEYSRFYDRNMYFDRMRYLVFDILPKASRNYSFDYVRFLYATLLIASNEIPTGILSPNRLYNLECENDEEALKNLLFTYEAKLNATKELLEFKIREIEAKQPVELTDRHAETIFCAKVNIPITLSSDFNKDELYISPKSLGLSGDCPASELGVWEAGYKRSKKALHKMLKLSRRSLNRASRDVRTEGGMNLDQVLALNEFQVEDIKEHIHNEELSMISIDLPDFYNEEDHLKKLNGDDKAIREKISDRMPRFSTVILGAILVLAYALGFFTLFYKNSASNLFNFSTSLIITLVAIGIFTVTTLIVLFFLRGSLAKRFKGYNNTMRSVNCDIENGISQYSTYLGHICNVRRGFLVLNTLENKDDPDETKIILYKKHIIDIENAKADMHDIFGHFIADGCYADLSDVEEYDYNYDRTVEYSYPLPYSAKQKKVIEFLQPGSYIEIPVSFVKKLTVRREDIYD